MKSHVTKSPVNISLIINLSIFSVPALALIAPSGYSYGAAILALIAIPQLILSKAHEHPLKPADKCLCIAFILYFITFFVAAYHDGFQIREFERPSRFLFAALIAILLIRRGIKPNWLLYGIITGSIGAGAISLYQHLILDISRPSGHQHTIAFGNNALMLALLAISCFLHFTLNNKKITAALCLIGFTLGVSAFILSATRGGWVATPLLIMIIWQYRKIIDKKAFFAMSLIITLASVFIISNQNLSSFNRLKIAHDDFLSYLDGNAKNSSTGIRMEMWKSAWLSFKDNPILGAGSHGSKEHKKAQISAGLVHPNVMHFDHYHNELITASALRGLLGLIGLLGIYVVPLLFFIKKLKYSNIKQKIYSLSGTITCLCYMTFGLTQSMLEHNSGAILYPLLVAFFWSSIRSLENTSLDNNKTK
jgi:O-antigen ligase